MSGNSSFGGTIKLQGESEYKKALKDITSNLTVLSSEMKVVTSQYDKNDKSAANLSQQNEVLTKKIENQKEKVKVLKQALEDSKKETGEYSDTTKKWQTALNNAEAELNKLDKELDDNTKSIKDFDKSTKEAGEGTLKLGDLIKANLISDVIKSGLTAIANGIKSIGSAMSSALVSGASYADSIITLSAQTGIATDQLQEYQAVAELTDVPLETITKSMAKMTKSLESNEEKYKSLGVSIRNTDGSLRNNQEIFNETIGKLGEMSNETERDALSMQLFGKSAQELNPLIKLGADGLTELTDRAHEMGAVLDENALKALGDLDDQFQIFKSTTKSTGNILASAFAPAVAGTTKNINSLMVGVNALIGSVVDGDSGGIADSMGMISNSVSALVNNISEQVPQLVDLAGTLIQTLGQALVDNLPVITSAGLQIITQLLNGITSNLGSILPVVVKVLMQIITSIVDNLPTILEAGVKVLVALIQGIAESLPTLIPTIVDAVILMTETLIDNIDLIIDAGIEIILGLAEGLIEALPRLIEKIPVIIDKLIMAIADNLPKIVEMGITLIIQLGIGLIKAIPQLLTNIPKIITSIVKGFANYLSNMADVGKNLVKGIWNGIKDATSWILDKIKGFGKSILKGIKSIFGIHSPSTVFRDEIGKNLALGIGEGFEDEMVDVNKEIQSALPTDFDLSSNVSLSNTLSNQNNEEMKYYSMVDAFKEALEGMAFKIDGDKMGELIIADVERVVYS